MSDTAADLRALAAEMRQAAEEAGSAAASAKPLSPLLVQYMFVGVARHLDEIAAAAERPQAEAPPVPWWPAQLLRRLWP